MKRPASRPRLAQVVQLAALSGFAPFAFYLLDDRLESILENRLRSLLGPAELRAFVTWTDIRALSLSFALTAFLLFARKSETRRPIDFKRLARLYAYCFVPAAILIFCGAVWVPKIADPESVVCFLLTGLFAEELLFRGALYALAKKVLPDRRIWVLTLPVFWTAALFGLHHFQFHGFKLTGPAAFQMGYTFLGGLYLGYLREEFDGIWAPAGIHLICNLFVVISQSGHI
jgi:membrane protease YdiL (CAAX protease family)